MSFGGWSIEKILYDEIVKILPEGKTILEFGSGGGTEELLKRWKVYSVEDDKDFIGKYNTNYIHAPLVGNWYDTEVLKKELPENYDLVLVDGPHGGIRRINMFKHIHLFKKDIPWILDDTNDKCVWRLAESISQRVGREIKEYKGRQKDFVII